MSEDYTSEARRRTDQREVMLAAAEDLHSGMKNLTASFEGVKAFSRETRRITKRIKLVIAVLAVIVVVLAVTTVRANNANSKANRVAEYQVANCEVVNVTRADTRGLWNSVIALLAPPGEKQSPGLKEFTQALQVRVDATFTPRDCSKIAEGKAQ